MTTSSEPRKPSLFPTLPTELLEQIVKECNHEARMAIRKTNRFFRNLVTPKLMFETVRLLYKPDLVGRCVDFLLSTGQPEYITYVRELEIAPDVRGDVETSVRQGCKNHELEWVYNLLRSCGPNLTKLSIAMSKIPAQERERRGSSSLALHNRRQYGPWLLPQHLGDDLQQVSMANLRTLEIRTHDTEFISSMFGSVLNFHHDIDRLMLHRDEINIVAAPAMFPSLRELRMILDLHSGKLGDTKDCIQRLTFGCNTLETLHIAIHPISRKQYFPFPPLANWIYSPSTIKTFSLDIKVNLGNTSPLIACLTAFGNLERVTLKNMLFASKDYSYHAGVKLWSHVFDALRKMPSLVEYNLDAIETDENDALFDAQDWGEGAEAAAKYWRLGGSFFSVFRKDYEALDMLEGVVVERREKLGLSREW